MGKIVNGGFNRILDHEAVAVQEQAFGVLLAHEAFGFVEFRDDLEDFLEKWDWWTTSFVFILLSIRPHSAEFCLTLHCGISAAQGEALREEKFFHLVVRA